MKTYGKAIDWTVVGTILVLVFLICGTYIEQTGLARNGENVKGKIEDFSFSGKTLMVYISFDVNGKKYNSRTTAGKRLRACYYQKDRPCIGDTCWVTYWRKDPRIIDYNLIN